MLPKRIPKAFSAKRGFYFARACARQHVFAKNAFRKRFQQNEAFILHGLALASAFVATLIYGGRGPTWQSQTSVIGFYFANTGMDQTVAF